jgi:hypothetical protein
MKEIRLLQQYLAVMMVSNRLETNSWTADLYVNVANTRNNR